MSSPEDPRGAEAPQGGPRLEDVGSEREAAAENSEPSVSYAPTTDNSYGDYEDPYAYGESTAVAAVEQAGQPAPPVPAGGSGGTPPPPDSGAGDDEDDDDDGMLRMSFLEHLEELRKRLLLALAGIGVAFAVSLTFAERLYLIVQEPAKAALEQLGSPNTGLTQISPMEVFQIVWMKLPVLTAIFLASPWVLYQVWAFIAPGLYKKERRWAVPFVISSAGLFILGGLFAYKVAFRFGLTFLLGIGQDLNITTMISVTEYFDLFINVILGIGIVFELPVLIFFLTLLRIVTPAFLIRNSRYAMLGIVALAAIVTPTPDVFNLMLFATPMCILFYAGVFASYLLTLHREEKAFPWAKVLCGIGIVLLLLLGVVYLAMVKYGYQFAPHWPFITQ
ncbi:MAG: twin-arginine translocase subunit TatC [Bryobacteraceae bacterium]